VRGPVISACFAACVAFTGGVACAAAYDDFMRGTALNRAGDSDHAIEAFTAAIAAGDLAATYIPSDYYGRATAYARKGKCALAEADLDSALKLRPAYLEAVILRANVRDCQEKYEDARADFDAAIKLTPTTDLYRDRGQFFWRHAKYDSAAADFLQAADVAPMNKYYGARRGFPLLWYAISAARAGIFDAALFDKRVDKADVDGWPEPLLEHVLGKMKPEDVYAKAARGDGPAPAQQKCEADFYLGEWQLGRNIPGGKELIQQAEKECPHNFVEYVAARTELKRLP
jgi:lipoprotein NlpI